MARIKPQALLLQSKKKNGPTRISVTTIIICNLVVVLIVFSLVASYRHLYRRLVNFSQPSWYQWYILNQALIFLSISAMNCKNSYPTVDCSAWNYIETQFCCILSESESLCCCFFYFLFKSGRKFYLEIIFFKDNFDVQLYAKLCFSWIFCQSGKLCLPICVWVAQSVMLFHFWKFHLN